MHVSFKHCWRKHRTTDITVNHWLFFICVFKNTLGWAHCNVSVSLPVAFLLPTQMKFEGKIRRLLGDEFQDKVSLFSKHYCHTFSSAFLSSALQQLNPSMYTVIEIKITPIRFVLTVSSSHFYNLIKLTFLNDCTVDLYKINITECVTILYNLYFSACFFINFKFV